MMKYFIWSELPPEFSETLFEIIWNVLKTFCRQQILQMNLLRARFRYK